MRLKQSIIYLPDLPTHRKIEINSVSIIRRICFHFQSKIMLNSIFLQPAFFSLISTFDVKQTKVYNNYCTITINRK